MSKAMRLDMNMEMTQNAVKHQRNAVNQSFPFNYHHLQRGLHLQGAQVEYIFTASYNTRPDLCILYFVCQSLLSTIQLTRQFFPSLSFGLSFFEWFEIVQQQQQQHSCYDENKKTVPKKRSNIYANSKEAPRELSAIYGRECINLTDLCVFEGRRRRRQPRLLGLPFSGLSFDLGNRTHILCVLPKERVSLCPSFHCDK